MWFTRQKTVTHPGTKRAWQRVTTLIETNVLPLSQTAATSTNELQFSVYSNVYSELSHSSPRMTRGEAPKTEIGVATAPKDLTFRLW